MTIRPKAEPIPILTPLRGPDDDREPILGDLVLLDPHDIDMQLEQIGRLLWCAESGGVNGLSATDPGPPYDVPGLEKRKAVLLEARRAYHRGRITVLGEWWAWGMREATRLRAASSDAVDEIIAAYQGRPGAVGFMPAVNRWQETMRQARVLHGQRQQVSFYLGTDPGHVYAQWPDGSAMANPIDADDERASQRILAMLAATATDLANAGVPMTAMNLRLHRVHAAKAIERMYPSRTPQPAIGEDDDSSS